MKGVAMKLGQVVSLMSGTVPDAVADQLAKLQSQAPPMAPELTRATVVAELGREPESVFSEFEWTAFAAASIGQVHRARLRSGERVAVKVQYPGVQQAVSADLKNMGAIVSLFGMVSKGLDAGPVIADLTAGIGAELDYTAELRNQERIGGLLDGHPFIRVPKVFPEFSTSRLLIQEYVPWHSFGYAKMMPADERNRIAEIIFRFTFGMMHRHGIFQADPHAGNYLIADDGSVAFVDFGCVAEFSSSRRRHLNEMIAGVVDGDLDVWRKAMEDIGYLPPDSDISTQELWDHMRLYYSFIVGDGVTFTPDLAAQMVKQNLQLSGEVGRVNRKLNIPAGMVFTQRINFGFTGLMASLRANGPWASIISEYVKGSPPATALGRQSQAWSPTGWI
ncbi:MAG: ABC1 kinase family protein [Dehalococcoidia bacterium]